MPFFTKKTQTVSPADALPGRDQQIPVPAVHFVLGNSLQPPFPDGCEKILVGMGCFWGAEKKFWETGGAWTTAAGYTAGFTPNATYEEVCSGRTGHNEAVLCVFDSKLASYGDMLKIFWESHNPTQGMRQGNDVGTQYRSGIYCFSDEQIKQAEDTKNAYQEALTSAGHGEITTEILPADEFYYAEEYHQQYLAKNPMGYCGLGGTGITY